MTKFSILALLGALVGGLLLWKVLPEAAIWIDGPWLIWAIVGLVLLLSAGILIPRPTTDSWKRAWGLLWLAAICLMGSYSSLYVLHSRVDQLGSQVREVLRLEADLGKAKMEERVADIESISQALNETRAEALSAYPGVVFDERSKNRIEASSLELTYLEYIVSVLFVFAFFILAWMTAPPAQKFYGFSEAPAT
jgi:hypothetical protein